MQATPIGLDCQFGQDYEQQLRNPQIECQIHDFTAFPVSPGTRFPQAGIRFVQENTT